MSEKQFDYIENRIREAAENSEPAFDEYAWSLMEARLNKDDNRKRPLILWWGMLALIMIGAGIIYFFNNKINNNTSEIFTSKKADSTITDKIKVPQEDSPSVTQVLSSPMSDASSKTNQNKSITREKDRSAGVAVNDNDITEKMVMNNHTKNGSKTKGKMAVKTVSGDIAEDGVLTSIDAAGIIPVIPGVTKTEENKVAVETQSAQLKKDTVTKGSTIISPDSKLENRGKPVKPSRFYLLAAIGVDAGSVKFLSFNNSGFTAKYGVGVGYRINKKISVQTGFYASDKKYIAGPGDYYAKEGSYWSMVQMVKVDASCLVYDIPLTLRYDFLQKSKIGFYATAGISSYIMKKEDYNYYYIRYNMPHEAAKSYTGNKDAFSVFNLSAGIERKISPVFYLQAEPYIGIPISGVGEGSVKLYSAGLQVAIKYQPVKKHK